MTHASRGRMPALMPASIAQSGNMQAVAAIPHVMPQYAAIRLSPELGDGLRTRALLRATALASGHDRPGTLAVESEVSRGSAFRVTIPLGAEHWQPARQRALRRLSDIGRHADLAQAPAVLA